jgi:hypothetical protein
MHHSAAGIGAKWAPIESKPARHVQRVIGEHRMVKAAALQVGCLAFWVFLGVLVPPARCLATDMRVVAVTPGQSAEVVIEDGAPVTIRGAPPRAATTTIAAARSAGTSGSRRAAADGSRDLTRPACRRE